MGLRCAEKSFIYDLEYEKVFQEAKNALSEGGFITVNTDEESGVIKAFAGASFSSYGEDVTITLSRTARGTNVNAHSRARAALFDWGKSGRNVNKFFAIMNERLSTSGRRVKSPSGVF